MAHLFYTVGLCLVLVVAYGDGFLFPATSVSPGPTFPSPRPTFRSRVSPVGAICPVCTNPYDPTTCYGLKQCADNLDMCELHVHTQDLFRIEYICDEYIECHNHEFVDCGPQNETCVYCCDSPTSCHNQREWLFNNTFPTFDPPNTPAPPTGGSPTTPDPGSTIKCLSCGDFAQNVPCSITDVITAQAQACPSALPYCYTAFTQVGTNVEVFKGCAENNFCKLEWDISGWLPECQNPDFTKDQTLSCAYCCKDDDCNKPVVPDQASLVTYP